MIKENQEEVHFDEIKCGDLFKLTKFKYDNDTEVGKIAQRYKEAMIFINESSGSCYPTIFQNKHVNEDLKAIIIKRAKN